MKYIATVVNRPGHPNKIVILKDEKGKRFFQYEPIYWMLEYRSDPEILFNRLDGVTWNLSTLDVVNREQYLAQLLSGTQAFISQESLTAFIRASSRYEDPMIFVWLRNLSIPYPKTEEPSPELQELTVLGAAKMLKLNREQVLDLIVKGDLEDRKAKRNASTTVFFKSDILEYQKRAKIPVDVGSLVAASVAKEIATKEDEEIIRCKYIDFKKASDILGIPVYKVKALFKKEGVLAEEDSSKVPDKRRDWFRVAEVEKLKEKLLQGTLVSSLEPSSELFSSVPPSASPMFATVGFVEDGAEKVPLHNTLTVAEGAKILDGSLEEKPRDYYTYQEVSDILHISKSSVTQWAKRGIIRKTKDFVPGIRGGITKKSVEALLHKKRFMEKLKRRQAGGVDTKNEDTEKILDVLGTIQAQSKQTLDVVLAMADAISKK